MKKNKYKYLMFDLDDTILDFKKGEQKALKKVFNYYELSYDKEIFNIYKQVNNEYWKNFELGLIEKDQITKGRFTTFFEKMNIKCDGLEANQLFIDELSKCDYLIEDSYKLLEKLSKDYYLVAVTNGFSQAQNGRLKVTGLDKYFRNIYISSEIGSQKPQKEFFDFVVKDLNLNNINEVLIIGDSLNSDIIGGINYGFDTCWLNPNDLATKLNPTYTITSLKELQRILEDN